MQKEVLGPSATQRVNEGESTLGSIGVDFKIDFYD